MYIVHRPVSPSRSSVPTDREEPNNPASLGQAYRSRSIGSDSVRSIFTTIDHDYDLGGARGDSDDCEFEMPGFAQPKNAYSPYRFDSPLTSVGDISSTRLTSIGSLSFDGESQSDLDVSQNKALISSKINVDFLLKVILQNDEKLSEALLGVEWHLPYEAYTTAEFASILTPTMKDWAEFGELTLGEAALFYGIFDSAIASAPRISARALLLSENLAVGRELATYLVTLINKELPGSKVNGSTTSERFPNEIFDFPPCVVRFAEFFALPTFVTCHLHSILTISISPDDRVARLSKYFDIDEQFARFFLYQYARDVSRESD